MNHPSDYANYHHYESSSDQSAPTARNSIKPRTLQSVSLFVPSKKSKVDKKQKPTKVKPKKKTKQKPRNQSKSDFLIVGQSYYSCKDVRQITSRLIAPNQKPIMKQTRLFKKQQLCIAKIQKYFKTFTQMQKTKLDLPSLSINNKIKLLEMLKQQTCNQITTDTKDNMDQLMRDVLETLQRKVQVLQNLHPERERAIKNWKNIKLHQFDTAKRFLLKQQQQTNRFNLYKQLGALQQENYFPQLRKETMQLKKIIQNELARQQEKVSYGQDAGVRWVLQHLLSFVQQRQEIRQQIYQKIYRFRQGMIEGPLLSDRLFVHFQQQQIGNDCADFQEQEISRIHIFNKSVFDLINQNVLRLCHQIQSFDQLLELACVPWQVQENGEQLLTITECIFQQILQEALQDFIDIL